MNPSALRTLAGAVALAGLILAGCSGSKHGGGESKKTAVNVAQVIESDVTDYEDFTGRTAAVESVVLKAQATGYLDKVMFKDGEFVKKNQQLYQIDDRTYDTKVKNARAAIKRTEATLDKATADLSRARQMTLGSSISREEYDQITARKQQAQATLVDDKATLELDLAFCKVLSPISGIVSRTQITPGNLVTQNQTTLTTVVSVDPIYGYFDVDERTTLRIQQMVREEVSSEGVKKADEWLEKHKVETDTRKQVLSLLKGRVDASTLRQIDELLKGTTVTADQLSAQVLQKYPKFRSYRDTKVPVLLATQIEKGYPHEGYIDFVDNQLNASTGTLRVRGNFPNPDRILTPNLFVRIRLPLGIEHKSLMVSDSAIVTQLDRKFVYVVNKDNVVEARPVRLGGLRGSMRVIEDGVEKGELVIVQGQQRVQPELVVSPTTVPMPDYVPPTKDKK
jgi:multidrug efflux pump subunit AcrA (membrane-fusion protein)